MKHTITPTPDGLKISFEVFVPYPEKTPPSVDTYYTNCRQSMNQIEASIMGLVPPLFYRSRALDLSQTEKDRSLKITFTPEMIKAGHEAMEKYCLSADPYNESECLVETFSAMQKTQIETETQTELILHPRVTTD